MADYTFNYQGTIAFTVRARRLAVRPNGDLRVEHDDGAVSTIPSGAWDDSAIGGMPIRAARGAGGKKVSVRADRKRKGKADKKQRDWHKQTDLGNAERLATRCRGKLLWVKGLGWLFWDERRWDDAVTGEEVREATNMVRAIHDEAAECSHMAAKATDDSERKELGDRSTALTKHARASESRDRIKGALELAKSRPGLVTKVGDLDADAETINVANGILDLDSLELQPHEPGARHTKITNAEYHDDASSKLWEGFLEKVLPDEPTRRWLQKMAGYSLLGRYSEYLPILYGRGKNGKSVFLRALRHALGDYAKDAPSDLLVAKRGSASAGDEAAIAALRGKRFVTSIETSEGKRLDEKTAKRLTGESEITAKFMKQNHITFHNQTAVWMATNHKPHIEGTDDAIWSRVALVPFEVWLAPNERDEELGKKLEDECDAVLAWAVEGLQMFHEEGLELPSEISEATGTYQDEMDRLGEWLSECCELVSGYPTPIKWVQKSYSDYCHRSNIHPLGRERFNQQLEQHRLRRAKGRVDGKQFKVWEGIRLLNEDVFRAEEGLVK